MEIHHISLFNHVGQLSDFITTLFHIRLLKFSHCCSMNETISALLKQQLVHVFCEPNFWAITHISGWGFWFCSSHLILLLSLSFFCICCQSLMVTFNYLQTELAPFGTTLTFARLLPVQPVRMTHTVDHAFYSALAN